MARDYAKPTRTQPDKPRKAAPGWLWMLGGLGVGLFIAGLVYLDGRQQGLPEGEGAIGHTENILQRLKEKAKQGGQAPAQSERPAPVESKPAPQEGGEKSRFDFYTILPELEVVIPEQEATPEPRRSADGSVERYQLQAGSFRAMAQADGLKARLALLGFEADIQVVESGGETWHRVRLGPYDSYRSANSIRNRLQRNEIQTLLMRVRQ